MKVKVLSLLQPWASLLFIPANGCQSRKAKGWETRSWKLTPQRHKQFQNNWLYIHASLGWTKSQKELLNKWPFDDYVKDDLPKGAIIGRVKVGEILTTEGWIARHAVFEDGAAERYAEEYHFGDYGNGRYAWEIKQAELLAVPIPAKGSLSIWEYDMPQPYGLSGTGFHASFTEPPNVETAKAVQTMIQFAKEKL